MVNGYLHPEHADGIAFFVVQRHGIGDHFLPAGRGSKGLAPISQQLGILRKTHIAEGLFIKIAVDCVQVQPVTPVGVRHQPEPLRHVPGTVQHIGAGVPHVRAVGIGIPKIQGRVIVGPRLHLV